MGWEGEIEVAERERERERCSEKKGLA